MVLIQESYFHLYFDGSLHHSALGALFTNLIPPTPLVTITYSLLSLFVLNLPPVICYIPFTSKQTHWKNLCFWCKLTKTGYLTRIHSSSTIRHCPGLRMVSLVKGKNTDDKRYFPLLCASYLQSKCHQTKSVIYFIVKDDMFIFKDKHIFYVFLSDSGILMM